jgi:PAS domain-containing protein
MLKTLSENFGYISTIFVTLTAIGAFFKPFRRLLGMLCRPLWMPWLVMKKLNRMEAGMVEMKESVAIIKKEVTFNGNSSMKDAVTRIEYATARSEGHRNHWFWVQGRPAMELDHHGKVIRVSGACCQLFRVDRPEDLAAMSWMRLLDPSKSSEFRTSLLAMMEYDSRFDFAIKLHDALTPSSSRGEWRLSLVPILPRINGEGLFTGIWIPVDSEAKAIAGRKRWTTEGD